MNGPNFKTVSEARVGNWGLYSRLKKHSLNWLKKINKSKYSVPQIAQKSRMTDEQVSELLLVSYEHLKNMNVRNRFSKGFLLRYCGLSESYVNSKKELPISNKLLNDISESIEQYQIRRISLTYQKLKNDDGLITMNKLVKGSSINRSKASKKVLRYLESFFY